MIGRTIYISNPYYLSIRKEQLILKEKSTEEETSLPVEDLAFIVFDCGEMTYSHAVLQKLAEYNVGLIFCDKKHMPAAMIYNFEGHSAQTQSFANQLSASEALRKNLWKQTIVAKIRNQGALLKKLGKRYDDILQLSAEVKSGDSDNREGYAARIYWSRLFSDFEFTRDRDGTPPNNFLNYAYSILRSVCGRALIGSGLLPMIGIKHKNKYNPYCLADDIMEPYRPYIDELVYEWYAGCENPFEINKEFKILALSVPTLDVEFENFGRPLMIGATMSSASMAKCFAGISRNLSYPEFK
jgi:CRISPR-associated protein Cas1